MLKLFINELEVVELIAVVNLSNLSKNFQEILELFKFKHSTTCDTFPRFFFFEAEDISHTNNFSTSSLTTIEFFLSPSFLFI